MLLEVARHAGRLVLALGVDDGDVAALGRERVADALAEPAIAAGDDGDRAFEFHVFPPIDPAQEMPSSRAAVPPRMAMRCSSFSPGVLSTRSTSVLVHGNG